MKFAVVSQSLPPNWSGQSTVIYRLLSGFNPQDYCLITQTYGQDQEHRKKERGRLAGKYYYLSSLFSFRRGWSIGLICWSNTIIRALQIARILKRQDCDAVIACPGDFFDLPAAYLASRLMKVRFYPYLFDYYSQQAAGHKGERFALRFEKRMMRDAASVIVPNEFMGDEMRSRYGAKSVVIVRNACDLSQYEGMLPQVSNSDEFKIVYTGSLYIAHFDAFRNLIDAIKKLGRKSVKLHLYTNQSREELEKNGISGPVILHGPEAASAIPNIQRQADLLFLPLAFDSPYPELIKTSAPGKTGEYLAAGKPVLVHAPPDSFLSWYFRRHNCGLVVDESDPAKLANALESLLSDAELQRQLSENALERSQSDFSVRVAQSAFAKLMKVNLPEPAPQQRLQVQDV